MGSFFISSAKAIFTLFPTSYPNSSLTNSRRLVWHQRLEPWGRGHPGDRVQANNNSKKIITKIIRRKSSGGAWRQSTLRGCLETPPCPPRSRECLLQTPSTLPREVRSRGLVLWWQLGLGILAYRNSRGWKGLIQGLGVYYLAELYLVFQYCHYCLICIKQPVPNLILFA